VKALLTDFKCSLEIRKVLCKAGFNKVLADQYTELEEKQKKKQKEDSDREKLIQELVKLHPDLKDKLSNQTKVRRKKSGTEKPKTAAGNTVSGKNVGRNCPNTDNVQIFV